MRGVAGVLKARVERWEESLLGRLDVTGDLVASAGVERAEGGLSEAVGEAVVVVSSVFSDGTVVHDDPFFLRRAKSEAVTSEASCMYVQVEELEVGQGWGCSKAEGMCEGMCEDMCSCR